MISNSTNARRPGVAVLQTQWRPLEYPNHDDNETGKFWQARFRAVRLLDEQALLACSAYVDLNPIRAAMAQTLETSDHTSVQRRIQALSADPKPLQPIATDVPDVPTVTPQAVKQTSNGASR